MIRISLKKKILFYFIMLMSVVFLIEFFSFVAFLIIKRQWFSFSKIYSEQNSLILEDRSLESASVEKTYDFLDKLVSAEILTEKTNLELAKTEFTINNDKREVLFEPPNCEVVFKDVPINENSVLNFGIGINQNAWDKSGDGILFEITVVDEKSQRKNVIFSQYIDPKNKVEDRKWFDRNLDLKAFAERKASFVFKTEVGPKGNGAYDLAGWSSPQITSRVGKKMDTDLPPFEVIHPYLGFVYSPEANSEGNAKDFNNLPISEYGFVDKTGPIHTKSSDKVILGIFGGSVAMNFSVQGVDSLINELRKSPVFFNKEFIIVRVALGGYKQPQQLMTLSYLLALGAEFDIIINIDGFNEVALPSAENIPKNVFPFFPRKWFMRVSGLPDALIQSIVGEITYLKSKRSKWARIFSKTPFRYSITFNLIWKYYDHSLAMAISRDQLTLQSYKPKVSSYVSSGPSRHYVSESDLFEDLASVWKMSSIQMHRLCVANGIRYFHFLQPNQYVAGSKIMGKEELKQAFLEGHPYKMGVEKGYPYLIRAGKELVKQGVNFHDLTMIFANKVEPIYVDTCCHFNNTGNDILGTVMGQAIIQNINNEHTRKEK